MRYRLQWGYCNGDGSTWWMIGILIGGSLVLAGPLLVHLLRGILLLFAAVCILAAPVAGVFFTRYIQRRIEAKKKTPKRRGPTYADYAYIL